MNAKSNVLVVTADSEAARRLEKTLQCSGVNVTLRHAPTLADAAEAFDAVVPEVVVTAWRQDGVDGAAVIKLAHMRNPDLVAIVVADDLDDAAIAEIADAGAQDVVTPSAPGRLAFAIKRAVAEAAQKRKGRQADEALVMQAAVAAAEHDAAPYGVFVVDRRGEVVTLNPEFLAMWGIAPEVAAAPKERTVLNDMLAKLADGEAFIARVRGLGRRRSSPVREQLALKDGRVFDLSVAPLSRGEKGGDYLGRAWFARDVTAIARAQEEMRGDQSLLRGLVDQDVAGIFVFDPDGAIEYLNPKFAQILGYEIDDVVGRNFTEFLVEDDRPASIATFRQVAAGTLPSAQVSVRVVARTGGTIDLLCQWKVGTYLEKPAVIGIALDVTALRQTEAALAESEDLYQSVVSALAEGVLVVDASERIVTCNTSAARILGVSENQILAHSSGELSRTMVNANGVPLSRDARPSVMTLGSGKPSFDTLIGVTRVDGTLAWLSVNTQPLFRKGTKAPYAAVISFFDVTSHKLDQDTLTRVNHALKVLSRANEVLVRAAGEQDLLDEMCEALVESGGYRLAWIGLVSDASRMTVRAVAKVDADAASHRPSPDMWDALMYSPTSAESVLHTRKPEIDQNVAIHAQAAANAGGGLVPTSGSRIVLPLLAGTLPLGILTLYADKPDAFTPDEVNLLVQLAEDLAYGVVALRERVRREDGEKRLRRAMEKAVQAIASTLEMRDPYTAGHQRDVARLAVAIAHELAVPDDEIEGIYLAAIVHDIGKIRIPVDILSKPAPLTKLEYELIQTHAQIGYEIVKNVDFPWPIAEMVHQHHERLNGSGYPNGLKDGDILQGAKIIAVADVVQAMSMRRPYRGPFGEAAALAEIERGRGTLYDPASVDACVVLFREKGFKFA